MHSVMDEIVTAISGDGFVSVAAICSTCLTERAQHIHKSTPVVTAALGRALAAASILGSAMKKSGAALTLSINGSGPAGNIVAVSDDAGNVRGFVQNPGADAPLTEAGELHFSAVVGNDGVLSVIRDYGEKEPYIGTSRLVSGNITDDIAVYLAASDQVSAICSFDVVFDESQTVAAAGGFIASFLPGVPERVVTEVKSNVKAASAGCAGLVSGGADTVIAAVMLGLSPRAILRVPVDYKCNCSRERYFSALLSLDKAELDDMKQKAEPVEASCQFCGTSYIFDPSQL